jgi:hypothetical protein
MTSTTLARFVSIVGHPAVVMPMAVLWAATRQGADAQAARSALLAAAAVIVLVLVYSVIQVRAGRWAHVDASVPAERVRLNLLLAGALVAATVGLWHTGASQAVITGAGLSAAIVVVALAARRALKLSLHCAFGAYAAALLWPSVVALLLMAGLAAAVAWSRLHLRRHTRAEVAGGLAAGVVAGGLFHVLGA